MQSINFRQIGIVGAQAAVASCATYYLLNYFSKDEGAGSILGKTMIKIVSPIIGSVAALAFNCRAIEIAGAALLNTAIALYSGVKVKNPDID